MSDFTRNTDGNNAILRPEYYSELVMGPILELSEAVNPLNYLSKKVVVGQSNELRVPVFAEYPTADWVGEGEEIVQGQPRLEEVRIQPTKVAGIVPVTRELIQDSTPQAAEIVGMSLSREVARQLDRAFFGDLSGDNPHAPKGLESLATEPIQVDDLTSLDPFLEAVYKVAKNEGNVSGWATHPDTALQVAKLKDEETSHRSLLADASLVLGKPLTVSPAVTPGTIWGIDGNHVLTVMNQDIAVEASDAPYFTRDVTALKVTARFGYGFPHPGAVAKIVIGNDDGADD